MTNERQLLYKFIMLPTITIIEICSNFKVLRKNDNFYGHDNLMNTLPKVWKRLKKKNKLKDLWWLLYKDSPNYKQLQNPFEI